MKNVYLFFLSFLLLSKSFSQISLTDAAHIYAQDFNSVGASATATLPTNWRIGTASTAKNVTAFSSAATATQFAAGANINSSASGGIYNFGNSADATDRCIGGIGSITNQSTNVYAYFKNNGTSAISNLTISYHVEKYKNGSYASGYAVQLYYSSDGTTWMSAGASFQNNWVNDANDNGFSPAPGTNFSIVNDVLNLSVSPGADFYLGWNISPVSGTIVSSSTTQGLGIDDLNINATFASTLPVVISSFTASEKNNSININWTAATEINMNHYELQRSNDGTNFTTLYNVAALNANNSQYNYIDNTAFAGSNFYILKSFEANGSYTFSNIIKISTLKNTAFAVTPTLIQTGSFNIQLNNLAKGKYQLGVYNESGVQILNKTISADIDNTTVSQSINLPTGLPRGLYIVRVYGSQTNMNQKIVVQ